MKNPVFLLRIIFFIPIFILSFFLLNLILTPVLSFLFNIIDFIVEVFYSMEKESILYKLFHESILVKGIVTTSSLFIGKYIYPGNDDRIPTIINSSILVIIYAFVIYYSLNSFSFMKEYLGTEEFKLLMKDVSIPRIIFEILGSLVGIGFSIYYVYNE